MLLSISLEPPSCAAKPFPAGILLHLHSLRVQLADPWPHGVPVPDGTIQESTCSSVSAAWQLPAPADLEAPLHKAKPTKRKQHAMTNKALHGSHHGSVREAYV